MSGQPTGEWTQEWLRQYLAGYSSYDLQLKATADAHNAGLASEREQVKLRGDDLLAERKAYTELAAELAAEREKRENSDRKWIVAAGQLRQQLAAALAKIGAK